MRARNHSVLRGNSAHHTRPRCPRNRRAPCGASTPGTPPTCPRNRRAPCGGSTPHTPPICQRVVRVPCGALPIELFQCVQDFGAWRAEPRPMEIRKCVQQIDVRSVKHRLAIFPQHVLENDARNVETQPFTLAQTYLGTSGALCGASNRHIPPMRLRQRCVSCGISTHRALPNWESSRAVCCINPSNPSTDYGNTTGTITNQLYPRIRTPHSR